MKALLAKAATLAVECLLVGAAFAAVAMLAGRLPYLV